MKLRNIAASVRHARAGRTAVAVGNVLACSGLVGFIACSDGGITEPVAAPAHAAALPSAPNDQPRTNVAPAAPAPTDTVVQTFVYNPATGGTVTFPNGARIVVPAGAVCAPITSGYGVGTWDKPCAATTAVTAFVVRGWIGATGNVQAVVSPDVRFVPGKVASLYLPAPSTDPKAKPVIQWCTSAMTQCVDEGATDPALTTQYDAKPGVAHRRIKHFSGYNVGWARGGSSAGGNAQ